jgi:hypothetical protein
LVTSLRLCLGYPVKEKKEMKRMWKEEDDDFGSGRRGKNHMVVMGHQQEEKDFVDTHDAGQ